MEHLGRLLRYAVPLLLVALGVAILCGFLELRYANSSQVRWTFGTVVVLYGVFRIVQLRARRGATEDERP